MPTLSFGEFYGEVSARRETEAGFVIGAGRPVGPPDDIPLHTHPEGSFTFILSGFQLSTARDSGAGCGPGSLVYNPPGTTHRDRFQRAEGGRFLCISLPPALVRSVALPEMPIRLQSHEALGLARAISRECVSWDDCSPAVAEGLCLQLLAAASTRQEAPRGRVVPRWLTQAQELLTDQCAESLSIASIARTVGVHPAHFARAFSHHFKRSPGEHLRRTRVARASALLVETRLPLVEIGLSCGFADQSHFNNVFRRFTGWSPAAYRRCFGRPGAARLSTQNPYKNRRLA